MSGTLKKLFKDNFSIYILFQALGWGFIVLVNIFFAITFAKYNSRFVSRLFVFVFLGVLWTSVMRQVIHKRRLMSKSLKMQLIEFFCITVIFGALCGYCESVFTDYFGLKSNTEKNLTQSSIIISDIFFSFIYVFIWNCIYFIYHYVEKSRRQSVDNMKLEATVKELELKSIQAELKVIKSHINPHFIFNSLNSIRALIDENPPRARKAVTELSNILRSSMLAEKTEVVPLEKEINIVKDYLELEHIRFEDRLQISYSLDENTLDRPVPPMLVQTLVENAIKHGISKSIKGGQINITSTIVDGFHMIIIQNTGELEKFPPNEGFGLVSTESRLKLLFGNKAKFSLKQIDNNSVEAKVLIPVEVVRETIGYQLN